MILLIILTLTAIILIGMTVLVASLGGAVGIIIFGDVIVCVLFIIWLIKKIIERKFK